MSLSLRSLLFHKRHITASATTNSTQEAIAAFGLKNATPIERKKMAGIARLL